MIPFTLINAREARELSENSNINVMKQVERICKEIRKAAEMGERSLIPIEVMPHDDWLKIERESFKHADFTPFQNLVRKELVRLMFGVMIRSREIKIGG
ncbi:hypothetical protein, partial [Flavobacterium sp.]|uniref:hypothetical protein n=1 Tax=Flavobacterium sp. TaxID=239 RepID=UPI0037BE7BD3